MNYLQAEAAIVQRLKDRVPGLKAVLATKDLVGLQEVAQATPAAHVVYEGETVESHAGDTISEQTWVVALAVRLTSNDTAGTLLAEIHKALAGWEPTEALTALERVNGGRPEYSPGGFAYYPMAFVTRLPVPADPPAW